MPMQNLATNTAEAMPETATSYMVSVEWRVEDEPDYHAEYYLAESDDIDGLVLQADSLGEMVEHILEVAPVLLELNHDTGEIAPDRVSVSPIGTVNPRGTTQYQVTISP